MHTLTLIDKCNGYWALRLVKSDVCKEVEVWQYDYSYSPRSYAEAMMNALEKRVRNNNGEAKVDWTNWHRIS